MYIAPDKAKVHQRPPVLNALLQRPGIAVLQNVEMRYIPRLVNLSSRERREYCHLTQQPHSLSQLYSRADLMTYLCHMHAETASVGFIGIDDFNFYCPLVSLKKQVDLVIVFVLNRRPTTFPLHRIGHGRSYCSEDSSISRQWCTRPAVCGEH